jgi:hypothetical protein
MSEVKKEVVWVIGGSGAGKETFIRRAAGDDSLAARFGWGGRLVVPCPASLDYIAQSPDDPITAKREDILHQTPRLLERAGVVLIKWQFADTTADRPARLEQAIPEAAHRAVVMQPPEEELLPRLTRKKWWSQYGSSDWIERESPFVSKAVRQLPNTFNVQHINSGQSANYEPLEDLPVNLGAEPVSYPGATGELIVEEN